MCKELYEGVKGEIWELWRGYIFTYFIDLFRKYALNERYFSPF